MKEFTLPYSKKKATLNDTPLKGLYIYENSFTGASITGVDGDITFDHETNVVAITGDGSITITHPIG